MRLCSITSMGKIHRRFYDSHFNIALDRKKKMQ